MIQKYKVPTKCKHCKSDAVYVLTSLNLCEDHYLKQIDIEFSKAMREAEIKRTGQFFLFPT